MFDEMVASDFCFFFNKVDDFFWAGQDVLALIHFSKIQKRDQY